MLFQQDVSTSATAILLLGGGGHCNACIDVIETSGTHHIVGIVQPPAAGREPVLGYPIVGCDEDLPALLAHTPQALVTIGQITRPEIRMRLFHLLKTHGAEAAARFCAKAFRWVRERSLVPARWSCVMSPPV